MREKHTEFVFNTAHCVVISPQAVREQKKAAFLAALAAREQAEASTGKKRRGRGSPKPTLVRLCSASPASAIRDMVAGYVVSSFRTRIELTQALLSYQDDHWLF